MSCTLVLLNANIIPMTANWNAAKAEALAVNGDRITAVGSNEEILALIGEHTRVLDLTGKSVLPGFIDTHVHFMQTGLGLRGPNLYNCSTVDEVVEIVRDEIGGRDKNDPLFFYRCRLLSLNRPLTRWDLDCVAPDSPVVVGDVEMHSCVVNSHALEFLDLGPNVGGVEIGDGAVGPTGKLTVQAHAIARSRFYNALDESVRLDALRMASEAALKAGVTTVHAIAGRDSFGERDVQVLLEQRDNLSVRLVLYRQSKDLIRALDTGVYGVADIWADGSYSDHSAALLEPYADDPSTRGKLHFTKEELNDFVWQGHRLGLQVSMHAVGDAAIEQVLNAYQHACELDSDFVKRRHRIEHFSLPTEAQIERARALGVGVAMQPALSAGPQEMVVRRLGFERAKRRHPYRDIVDKGLLVAGGSDSDFSPIDPLGGIQVLVDTPVESRRLNVLEALSLFTINASKIAHEDDLKGTIEPGKLADLVVLADNPLTVDPFKLKDIPVEITIVGGRVVYDACAPS